MDIRFSDQAEVIAALAVSEGTDNETLISARENFILAAKMVDGEKFNETSALYAAGNSVTLIRPKQMIDRFLMAYSDFHGEREGPWARLGRMFKR